MIYPPGNEHIPFQVTFEDVFPFPRWDMLVPWRVADPCREPRHILDHFSANPFPNEIQNPKTNCFHSENSNKITQKPYILDNPSVFVGLPSLKLTVRP